MLLVAEDQPAVRDDEVRRPRWRMAPRKTKSPLLPVGFRRRLGQTEVSGGATTTAASLTASNGSENAMTTTTTSNNGDAAPVNKGKKKSGKKR